jgi:hypothetical protein
MRIFIVALMIVSLTIPAYAQTGGMGGGKGGRKGAATGTSDPNAAQKNAAEEKAFNEAVKRIPASNNPVDPWSGVRDLPKK